VPAYNERLRIAASLGRILDFLSAQRWDAEVLVVNDGSKDDTAAIVASRAQADPRVRLLENPGNRGKGYSVRNGMLHARGELLFFTDADLSSPVEEVVKLAAAIRAGADVAIGSRWLRPEMMSERQPLARQFMGRSFNLFMHLSLGLRFKDTQCGLKAFTRRAALEIFPRQHIERWGFDGELLFLAARLGLQVAEVPVAWAHDDRSKIHPIQDGVQMVKEALQVRWFAIRGRYRRPVFPPQTDDSADAAASETPQK
jgi:glycosyltransferase involved in cell wall biosynthesis